MRLHEARWRLMFGRQMIPGANVSRTLARTGVDWVLVDCEFVDDMRLRFIG